MSLRTRVVLFMICLQAAGAFAAETYESFAKDSLGVDLATIPFGTAVTKGGFGKTDAPLSGVGLPDITGLEWMTNDVSGKYNHDFENRFLKYGFRDGKLAVVRVSISAFGGPGFQGGKLDWSQVDAHRRTMVPLQDKYWKIQQAEKAAANPSRFNFRYGAMCSPTPESLFVMEFQITPAAAKKTQ